MIREFVAAFRAYWSVEAIAARMERLAARMRSWPWPPGEHPQEPLREPLRVRTPPQLRIAASFTELENGNWLWRAQLEEAPDFFMVGVAGSAPEAKREAAESAEMLERRRQEWKL